MILVDTHVFIGACMGIGASAAVIGQCIGGRVQAVMGSALFAEHEDVLSRTSLFANCRLNQAEREELFNIYLSGCIWRTPYFVWRPNARDEGDNHIIELAVAGAASHIVTWNIRDFSTMELRFPSLRVCSPPDYLKELRA